VGDEKVEAEHVVRRLAGTAAIDPDTVLELVALPRLADGEADEQGDEADEQGGAGGHQEARNSETAAVHAPWARRTCSMHSRAAPRPPPAVLTQWTAARTSAAASAGAAAKPARRSTG